MSLDYTVSYAGIPLLVDTAKVLRQSPIIALPGQIQKQDQIRKQQPEIDLIDELNRLISFNYLQDFYVPTYYHNRNLGAVARPSHFGPQPGPTVQIGDFYYPTGATRWSVYRGLATSSMVAALLKAVGSSTVNGVSVPAWNSAQFIMEQNPISPNNPTNNATNYTLKTNLYMLPPRPLAEHGNQFDGLYLITLVDERYQGQYLPISFHITNTTTWDDLISQLAVAQNIQISYAPIPAAYGQPSSDSQLWMNQETVGPVFDAIAANLGRVVVRNLDGTYKLQTYEQAQQQVVTNRGVATSVVRFAGGDIFNSGAQKLKAGDLTPSRNAVIPANVQVTFPKYVIGNDPVPHYLNSRYASPRPTTWYEESYGEIYQVTIPVGSGGPAVSGLVGFSGYTHVIHTTAKALYSGELQAASGNIPLNASGGNISGGFTSGLSNWVVSGNGIATGYNLSGSKVFGAVTSGITSIATLANKIAQDYYYSQSLEALDEVYPGIFVWVPEGIHDIVWKYSSRERQATTRVLKRLWNVVIREMQHSTPLTSYASGNTNVPGVGGPSVSQTWIDQSGNNVYGVNCVSVIGGIVSGQLYSGGVQEVFLTIPVQSGGGTTPSSGQPWTAGYIDNSLLISGMLLLQFDGSGFILSGNQTNDSVQVYHNYGLSGDIQPVQLVGSPGTLGKVARADHIHPMSGAIQSGMIASGITIPVSLLSGSQQYITLASGTNQYVVINSGTQNYYILGSGNYIAGINKDCTQFTNPWLLGVANNSYSGYRYGRILLTNWSSGPQTSGTTLISGAPFCSGLSGVVNRFIGQLDWQGQRTYHSTPNLWFGPQPDLELVDTTTVSWSGGVDSGVQTLLLKPNVNSGTVYPVPVVTYSTQLLGSTYTITTTMANIGLSINLPSAGTYLLIAALHWTVNYANSFIDGVITAQLYDGTFVVSNSDQELVNISISATTGTSIGETSTISIPYTATGAVTINVQAQENTTTGSVMTIDAGGAAFVTSLTYIRIA